MSDERGGQAARRRVASDREQLKRLSRGRRLVEYLGEHAGEVVDIGATDGHVALREDRTSPRPILKLETGRTHHAVRHATLAQSLLSLELFAEDAAGIEADDWDVGRADELLLLGVGPVWTGHACAREHDDGRRSGRRGARPKSSRNEVSHASQVDRLALVCEARGTPQEAIRTVAGLSHCVSTARRKINVATLKIRFGDGQHGGGLFQVTRES